MLFATNALARTRDAFIDELQRLDQLFSPLQHKMLEFVLASFLRRRVSYATTKCDFLRESWVSCLKALAICQSGTDGIASWRVFETPRQLIEATEAHEIRFVKFENLYRVGYVLPYI